MKSTLPVHLLAEERPRRPMLTGIGAGAPGLTAGGLLSAWSSGLNGANPRVLLGEVSLGLASAGVRQIDSLLPELLAVGVTVLLVEQDVSKALRVASGRVPLAPLPASRASGRLKGTAVGSPAGVGCSGDAAAFKIAADLRETVPDGQAVHLPSAGHQNMIVSVLVQTLQTADVAHVVGRNAKGTMFNMRSEQQVETITLGAGCFWCLDAIARRTPGFLSSVVGYAGGDGPPPSYYDLHYSGASRGFVESVQLTFDTEIISLEIVLSLFFQSHDPTLPNQDGANYGPEYHSTIFYHNEEQRLVALREIETLSRQLKKQVVTSVRPLNSFFEAEPEHQDFYNENIRHPYCRIVILPKLRKLDKA